LRLIETFLIKKHEEFLNTSATSASPPLSYGNKFRTFRKQLFLSHTPHQKIVSKRYEGLNQKIKLVSRQKTASEKVHHETK
jgi:hypothetical protein